LDVAACRGFAHEADAPGLAFEIAQAAADFEPGATTRPFSAGRAGLASFASGPQRDKSRRFL